MPLPLGQSSSDRRTSTHGCAWEDDPVLWRGLVWVWEQGLLKRGFGCFFLLGARLGKKGRVQA